MNNEKQLRRFHLSIHQKAAIVWVVASSAAFSPLLIAPKVEDTGEMLAAGIVIATCMILIVPLLLKWMLFRRWFCWTDALSVSQRQAIETGQLRHYRKLST